MNTHSTPHDPAPGGPTDLDRQRNADLLTGYDYNKTPGGITGYAGQDLQRIARLDLTHHAVRTRVGPPGNYKAAMTCLDDDTLVLAVCRQDPDDDLFKLFIYESNDRGLIWQQIAATNLAAKEPSLTRTADGAILLTAQHADFRPDSQNVGVIIARSTDAGRTWTRADIPPSQYPKNVCLDHDSSLLFLTVGPSPDQIILHRSTDHGQTWTQSTGHLDWDRDRRAKFAEIAILRLADRRLLAALRHYLPAHLNEDLNPTVRGHAFADTVLTESADNGATWSRPRPLTGIGEVHTDLLQLTDGRLLATYVNYHLPFGACAVVSNDNGDTWDTDHPYQLSCSSFWPANNGWPVTLQLEDQSLLTCYAANAYPNDPPAAVCEVVRWNLAP
ncbi:MAG: hypothetical protein CMJ49_00055 [Planctomycetaceae bacterium]|nr:hypothetical protein [Planctomycetaceae bacterium]